MSQNQTPEFSRIIDIASDVLNKKTEIVANQDELKKLAERFGLHEISDLKLEYIVAPKEDIQEALILSGRLLANVTKFIINEFEEKSQIDEKFDVILIEERLVQENLEQIKDCDIEIIDDNIVDIGEIASQYLSLCVYM